MTVPIKERGHGTFCNAMQFIRSLKGQFLRVHNSPLAAGPRVSERREPGSHLTRPCIFAAESTGPL